MLFNSTEFLLFLPIVFGLYWLLRRRLLWQNLFVVAASWLFYGWWDWRFLLLIAFTTGCSYLSGILQRDRPRRGVMWANVVLNLAVLGLFKYHDFFVRSFADAFLGGDTHGLLLHLVLPVGISFYTFQALSYTIDVYRRAVAPTRDAAAFFAYVSFFPQLVAGPIERATSLLVEVQDAPQQMSAYTNLAEFQQAMASLAPFHYRELPLVDTLHFCDKEHLNASGAELFNTHFLPVLQKFLSDNNITPLTPCTL